MTDVTYISASENPGPQLCPSFWVGIIMVLANKGLDGNVAYN